MRTVFFGSGEFAVPALERLHELDGPHRLVGVVSRPARPAGRGKKLRATPLACRAEELGLQCDTPRSVNDPEFLDTLRQLEPDLFIVVDYGEFLRKPFRELPRIGAFNLHASLLPAYRGAAPVAYALLEGEERTGVTLFRIERELDAGPIVDAEAVEIRDDETTGELEDRLSGLAAALLERNLPRFSGGAFAETPQDARRATFAPKIQKRDALIDWSADATAVIRRARAFNPWPGAFTSFASQDKQDKRPERITFWRLRPAEAPAGFEPGAVCMLSESTFTIRCGCDAVEVVEIQRAGKARLGATEFLRGYPLHLGERFGD